MTAFRTLPKRERQAVLAGIAADRQLREDLFDLAVVEQRQRQPSRPFRSYLKEKAR